MRLQKGSAGPRQADRAAHPAGLRVLVADDHGIVRGSIVSLLRASGIVEAIEEAANGIEAIAAAKLGQPDLAVVDINMPYANGVEVITEIRRWSKRTRILVFTGVNSPRVFADLISAGVSGVILKSESATSVELGLRMVLRGGEWFSEEVRRSIIDDGPTAMLTLREHQVLHHVARGSSNTAIADALNISAKTVDKHRASLMRKLDAHTSVELVRTAIARGLLDTPEV